MNFFRVRSLREPAARCLAFTIACVAPLLCTSTANAQRPPAHVAFLSHDRVFAAALRPRHIATFGMRTDLRGDTPYSGKYFKITNVTAEVNGFSGWAAAVNNDGRIVYNDDGIGGNQNPPPYIVNNAGGYDALPFPNDECVNTTSAAYALNEAGEAVGTWGCNDPSFFFQGYAGWSLTGATTSKLAYYDQRYGYYPDGSYAAAVNVHDVAVGCDGGCISTGTSGSAALFEPAKSSHGALRELRGLKGKQCYAAATAINDASQIVGFACDKAVRFSLNGYAEPLVANEPSSSAQAINARDDVVGYFYRGAAFLYRLGKMSVVPLPAGDNGLSNYAYAINASGEIVGDLAGQGLYSAFVYLNGRSYDLNTLIPPNSGWTVADAYGVNDRGEIVGDGYYNGTLYGISLKPPA